MKSLPPLLRTARFILLVVLIILAYALSIQVTQPDFGKLIGSFGKSSIILDQLLKPDLFVIETESTLIATSLPIPCGSAPEPEASSSGPRLTVEPACADVKDRVVLKGYDLGANQQVVLKWLLPEGGILSVSRGVVLTDGNGYFEFELEIRPILVTKDGVPVVIEAEVKRETGRLTVSQTLTDVFDNIMVTIFMALMATTFGTILALPLSFLGASNITRKGWLGSIIYYLSRSIMNLVRSFEPLVIATIFALMVGFGSPFAGIIALTFVTTASLGKMFSESVESIDPGPLEAITATGGSRLQVIIYAVIPQIMPDFLSFTLYHWDINVRISTIIGFVGGGGIGYYLSQIIATTDYSKAGTAILAIIIVVWVLDFISAQARKRLI